MTLINTPKHTEPRRHGLVYRITEQEKQQFAEQGYLVLPGVLSETELEQLDPWFEHFISGQCSGMGKDLCDMTQSYDTPLAQFQLINAMLPSVYEPEFGDNVFTWVAQFIADQLYDAGKAQMDYEQFLAKKPNQQQARFALHQDLGYWPKTEKTWTATFSLALTDSDQENGCLQVVPGSNRDSQLRKHLPLALEGGQHKNMAQRSDNHTLTIETQAKDEVRFLPVKRGDVTIHDERIIHGSGGNRSDRWRKTYVMAFRDAETIAEERAMGFTHSHNDKVNWQRLLDLE